MYRTPLFITQMSAPWVSRIRPVVRSMTPQNVALCSVISNEANDIPTTMARYFPRSPVSILSATQVIGSHRG